MIDLHIHSIYSDGNKNVSEIVELAKKNRIKTISITDHNTIESQKDLLQHDIHFIRGIELYGLKEGVNKMHILGYDFEVTSELASLLKELEEKRIDCMQKKLSAIKEKFLIDIPMEGMLKSRLNDHDIKIKLMQFYELDYVIEVLEYIKSLKIKVDKKVDYRRIISVINSANGIPVLAHPKKLKCDDFEKELTNLIENGLKGIEVYHSSHTKKDVMMYLDYAKKYNLLISGGSDYHGYDVFNALGEAVEIGHIVEGEFLEHVNILEKVKVR